MNARLPVWCIVAALAFAAYPATARAQLTEVFFEDFEGGTTIDLDDDGVEDGTILGNAVVQDLGDGRGALLSLTQGDDGQAGYAWFDEPFDLRDNKVVVDFDLYIRSGLSDVPADGMSVVFQFGDDLNLTGGGGGGLGTGYPGGNEYVSVAFDIWDNEEGVGTNDPETQCDLLGGNRTCHVEVNQNTWPGSNPSLQTNVDFGVEAPNFIEFGDQMIPIHAQITFDNGAIEVTFEIEDDPVFGSPVTVLQTSLADFPADANALIGFAASTGGANAWHEVDNVGVRIGPPTPQVNVDVKLGGGTKGAINCGSDTEVTGQVGGETFTFVPDGAFGRFLGKDDTVVPNENRFAQYGFDPAVGGNAAGPVPDAIAGLDDPALEPMYQTERWQNGPVAYRFEVDDGRYEVNLHFAEICPACGVNGLGEATRRVGARIEGEPVLSHWSSALAAGNEAGTGPVALTAVTRTFSVDVTDGVLEVVASDLGLLGTPPENAQINGISYRRTGAATGQPASGDIEDLGPVQLPDISTEVLVDEDFEAAIPGECPEGWTCNDNGVFTPVVNDFSDIHGVAVSQRLRLTDVTGSVATTVIYNTPADLDTRGFEAEYTVHLTQPPGTTPADGMTFFFLPGDESVLASVGGSGGSLAYSAIGATSGFAVEIDTYQGAGDPNGIVQTGSGHVGLVVNGDVTQHIQTSATLDPAFQGPTWPIRLVDDPLDLDAGQFPFETLDLEAEEASGLRVRVRLNNGRFRVWLATVNQSEAAGFVFPETLVIDTLTDYGVSGLGQGYFGFSAATGGAMTYHEVDDVKISLILNKDVEVARRVPRPIFSDSSTPIDAELSLRVEPGTGAHDVDIVETLPAGWSADSISDSGSVAGGAVTWNLTGVDADRTVTYRLVPADGAAGDTSFSGTYAVDGRDPLPIGAQDLAWVPLPFPRGDAEVVLDESFDGLNGCVDGWTCNTSSPIVYTPGVTQEQGREGRLQLTNQTLNLATSAVWNTPVDVTDRSLVVEFDAYFSNDQIGATPADGLTLMLLDADVEDPALALGAGGGALGYGGRGLPGPLSGLAVELDLWQGGTDPSGFNANGYGHIAVIRDGDVNKHVQTMLDHDPDLRPASAGGAGWPNFVDTAGTGFPLHVEADYNNGSVKVWLSAPDTGEGEFLRTLVLDTGLTFPAPDGSRTLPQRLLVGFSAGTGGSVANQEVDNFRVTAFSSEGGAVNFERGDADASGALNITDGIFVLNFLFLGGPEPPCRDGADADDSGSLNITDGIFILNFLFLGGPDPAAPGPNTCGPDPTEDDFDCAAPSADCQ